MATQLLRRFHHHKRLNSCWGHFLQFDFVVFVMVGMFAGRKLGWANEGSTLQLTATPHDCICASAGRAGEGSKPTSSHSNSAVSTVRWGRLVAALA